LDEPPSFSLLNISFDQGLLYFCITAVLVFFTAYASAAEAAFFSLHADDLDRFRKSTDDREKAAADLLVHSRLLLGVFTTCQYAAVSAAAVLFVITFSFRSVLDRLSTPLVIIGSVFLITAFALLGIILPKIYGESNNVHFARVSSKTWKFLSRALRPVLNPLLRKSDRVEKQMEEKTEENTATELSHALQLATVENEEQEGEKEILAGIVNFSTLTVKQIMRSRSEISFTDISIDFHHLMDFVRKSGYSRVPVCRDSMDKVEGILYIKDLLPFLNEKADFAWQKLLRQGYFVHEDKKADILLKDFQEKRVHMALVTGDHGTLTGLITLEDIIEEIIGDINDEFDEVGARHQKVNDTTYLFDGKTSVQEFLKIVGVDPAAFNPVKGISVSLSGLLLESEGELPVVGDEIVIEPFTFIVENIDRKRIKRIRVKLNEPKKNGR
jgi:putative hemolysin